MLLGDHRASHAQYREDLTGACRSATACQSSVFQEKCCLTFSDKENEFLCPACHVLCKQNMGLQVSCYMHCVSPESFAAVRFPKDSWHATTPAVATLLLPQLLITVEGVEECTGQLIVCLLCAGIERFSGAYCSLG